MDPTKERKLRASGTDEVESMTMEDIFLGTPSPDPWDLPRRCQSQSVKFAAGAQLSTGPSLVLAPESALGLLPSIALSSAPVACSVSRTKLSCKGRKKKELDYRGAFRHVAHRADL